MKLLKKVWQILKVLRGRKEYIQIVKNFEVRSSKYFKISKRFAVKSISSTFALLR
jgi:hypothetical protein